MNSDITKYTPKPPTFEGLRLGAKTVKALEYMAMEGMTLRDAAIYVEMRPANLQRTFDKPAVRKRFLDLVRYIVENEAVAAFLRISKMAKEADSEHVRLEANKWLAGVRGLVPVRRTEARISHHSSFGGYDYGDGHTIDESGSESDDEASDT